MEFIKVRKKPVEVEAVQLTSKLWTELFQKNETITINGRNIYPESRNRYNHKKYDMHLDIETLEGIMEARIGDWIIKGINGEIYPCKPNIFKKTYEVIQNE